MDFITREQARQNIVELGLPPIVLDAFDGKPMPYNLDINFRCPDEIFCLEPDEMEFYDDGPVTPVWMGCGFYVVAYHHGETRRGFFRFDIEGGDEAEPEPLNWQQIFLKEFIFLWELEHTDAELREIAELFRFNHCETLLIELPKQNGFSFEQHEAWYQTFLKQLG